MLSSAGHCEGYWWARPSGARIKETVSSQVLFSHPALYIWKWTVSWFWVEGKHAAYVTESVCAWITRTGAGPALLCLVEMHTTSAIPLFTTFSRGTKTSCLFIRKPNLSLCPRRLLSVTLVSQMQITVSPMPRVNKGSLSSGVFVSFGSLPAIRSPSNHRGSRAIVFYFFFFFFLFCWVAVSKSPVGASQVIPPSLMLYTLWL